MTNIPRLTRNIHQVEEQKKKRKSSQLEIAAIVSLSSSTSRLHQLHDRWLMFLCSWPMDLSPFHFYINFSPTPAPHGNLLHVPLQRRV
jgi:hypothetical protein